MAFSHSTTYIPLKQAAQKFGLSEKVLLDQIKSGSIVPARLPNGELLVAENDVDPKARTKEQIIDEKYAALKGQYMTITEASTQHDVPGNTIREWVALDYIRTISSSYPMKLNRADVAYCADIYHERKSVGVGFGVPLLDENGLQYELKHPELSAYRRRRKQKKQSKRKI